MVPWHSEYSWALVIINEHSRGLMVPRQLSLNCLRMLLRAHECSRVLKTAPLCSWLRKRWIKKHIKCQLLKWLPCSNLQISQSRFHQIIKWWTFSNSTRKGQLKNVQDGISRPLGSWEIKKKRCWGFFWTPFIWQSWGEGLVPRTREQLSN